MDTLDRFELSIESLTAENQHFEYDINDDFFEAVEAGDIHKGSLKITIATQKMAQNVDLHIVIDGTVGIPCDRCLDEMQQDIQTEARLMAKIGEEYSEEDDLVTIDEASGILNVAWFIYEFIALQIPIKHVHAPGKCNSAMIQMLNEHSATRSSDEDEEKPIDPRWSGLLKIKEETKESNN